MFYGGACLEEPAEELRPWEYQVEGKSGLKQSGLRKRKDGILGLCVCCLFGGRRLGGGECKIALHPSV